MIFINLWVEELLPSGKIPIFGSGSVILRGEVIRVRNNMSFDVKLDGKNIFGLNYIEIDQNLCTFSKSYILY